MQKHQALEVLRLLETMHDAQEPERGEDLRTVFQPKMPAASESSLNGGFSAALFAPCPALPPTAGGRL